MKIDKIKNSNLKKNLVLGWRIPQTAEEVKDYIETGVHSGIPWCCIYYMICIVPRLSLRKLKFDTGKFWKYIQKNSLSYTSNGYHSCPECVKANWAKRINFCCTVHRIAKLAMCKYKFIPEVPSRKTKAYFGLPLGHKAYIKLSRGKNVL